MGPLPVVVGPVFAEPGSHFRRGDSNDDGRHDPANSAPALPAGFSAFGLMFAFTPHGTTFAVPVTMTLPFNPAAVPVGAAPAFYKTNAQNQ